MAADNTEDHGNPDITLLHEGYMRRAMELALNGVGQVSPNPLVGSVIVHHGKIIGEGWHRKYGQHHAEVNAINNVTDETLLPESTLYVNLEPCAHTGKTPPCADLIIRKGIRQVVIANRDLNPLVSGNGIKKLRDAGIDVVTEILSQQGSFLNRRFFTYMEKRRPYIILKWAETSDGFIARENYDSKWISDHYSRQLVHKWRSEEDAVAVGSRTAHYDNPSLNVRDWTGRDPVRLVIDRSLKLQRSLNLFNGRQKTICYNLLRDHTEDNLQFVRLEADHFIQQVTGHLFEQKIQSVIIEGGTQLLDAFIKENLWDEARIFISKQIFRDGVAAPRISGMVQDIHKLDKDHLKIITRAETTRQSIIENY